MRDWWTLRYPRLCVCLAMKRLFGVRKDKPPPPTLEDATGSVRDPSNETITQLDNSLASRLYVSLHSKHVYNHRQMSAPFHLSPIAKDEKKTTPF